MTPLANDDRSHVSLAANFYRVEFTARLNKDKDRKDVEAYGIRGRVQLRHISKHWRRSRVIITDDNATSKRQNERKRDPTRV